MAESQETGSKEMPVDWKKLKLGDLIEIKHGYAFKSKYFANLGSVVLTPGNFRVEGGLYWGLKTKFTTEVCKSEYVLQPSDLVLVMTDLTPSAKLLGSPAFIPDGLTILHNQRIGKISVVSNKVSSEFLYWVFLSSRFKLHMAATATGSTVRHTSPTRINEYEFCLPPSEEQQAIVIVLRSVQRAKEATENVIAAARKLKQSLMQHLFTYGPIPHHNADQVELQETDFGEAPQHWATKLLDDCCTVQTGAAKGRRFGDDETVELPYLRVANVQGGYLDLEEMKTITIRRREIDRYSLQEGDVVLTEGGDFDKLGRGFIWRNEIPGCLHQNHVFAVRANRTKLLPEFLAHQTQSEYGRAYFLSVAHRTTNLACINTTKLKAFPMLIPPLSEQREIEANLDAVDKKLAQEEQKLAALSSLFNSLLHELMIGQRRVAGLDMSEVP